MDKDELFVEELAPGQGCARRQRRHVHLFKTSAEPLKHFLHVSSFLHGDDPRVVLLVDPD